jgi:DNA-binding transcriptional regulator LsrR (DeoR family)
MTTAKKRGRKVTTGNCATREELEEQVKWFYKNTSMSAAAIGRRLAVSHRTALNILSVPKKY